MKTNKLLLLVTYAVMIYMIACTPAWKMNFFETQGIFVGEKYLDKTTGRVTEFTDADRPVLNFQDSLIILQPQKTRVRLLNVNKVANESNMKKGVLIASGVDSTGRKFSMKFILENYKARRNSYNHLILGTIHLGDYDAKLDVGEVYYRRIYPLPEL